MRGLGAAQNRAEPGQPAELQVSVVPARLSPLVPSGAVCAHGHRNWRGLRRGPGPPASPSAPILRPPKGGGLAVPPLAGRSGPPFRPRAMPYPTGTGGCAAPSGSAELDQHHKIWYARGGGDHNMEEDGKIYKMLMAMTEVEAAALTLLDTIDREREALRSALEGGKT